jgi:hypothetical protein
MQFSIDSLQVIGCDCMKDLDLVHIDSDERFPIADPEYAVVIDSWQAGLYPL